FFSSRRRHTRCLSDWSSDVCSSDLAEVCRAVRKVLSSAASQPRIEIPEPEGGDTAPFTDDEKRAILELVDRTSREATEEFRKGRSEERRVGKEGRWLGST